MVAHRRRGARRARAAAALARADEQHLGPPPRPRPRLRHRRHRLQLPHRRAPRRARPEPPAAPGTTSRRARRETVRAYRERLAGIDGLELCFDEQAVERSSHFAFPVLLADRETPRPLPRPSSRTHGIQTTWYPALHRFTEYARVRAGRRPAGRDRGRRAPLRAAAQLDRRRPSRSRSSSRRCARRSPRPWPASRAAARVYSRGISRSRTDSNSSWACS